MATDVGDESDRAWRSSRRDFPAAAEVREGREPRTEPATAGRERPQGAVSFFFEDPLKPGVEAKAGHPLKDFVSAFLTTSDGFALSRAFTRIKNPRTLRSVVKLVEDIACEIK